MNIDMEALQRQAMEEQEKKQVAAQEDERRAFILDQILEPDAKERMNRLALVKAAQAKTLSDSLIKAALSGQLQSKITDDGLKKMLESGTGADGKPINAAPKITFQRRKFDSDSEDDDSDLL